MYRRKVLIVVLLCSAAVAVESFSQNVSPPPRDAVAPPSSVTPEDRDVACSNAILEKESTALRLRQEIASLQRQVREWQARAAIAEGKLQPVLEKKK